jgi:hypothetical protein
VGAAPLDELACVYARFADHEAHGRSPLYVAELGTDRIAFADTLGTLDAVWIANDPPGLLTGAAASRDAWPSGRFLLTQDERPIAWTDPHRRVRFNRR